MKDHPILSYRLAENMSVQDFADLVDYSRQHIHQLESGQTNMSMKAAHRIEYATDGYITVQELSDWQREYSA